MLFFQTLPITWALMTNKTKESYTDILNYFKTELAPHLNIESVTSDFELGIMRAVRSSYINAHPHGCYFHLTHV